MNTHRRRPVLETLEDRLTPTFTSIYQPTTDTWILTQLQDGGDVVISSVLDQLSITTTTPAGSATVGMIGGNLIINMLDTFDDTVTFDNAAGLSGNLTINLGNGNGTAEVEQSTIGGNLNINAGTGDHTVNIAFEGDVNVFGSVNINLGLGNDSVNVLENSFLVGSNVTLRGVNSFGSIMPGDGTITVGGNVSMYDINENLDTVFDPVAGGALVIGGNFTYRGGNGNENVRLADSVIIGGNVHISLGNDISGMAPQIVDMGAATIGGSVTILGGTVTGQENILTSTTTLIGGNIYINTGALGSPGDAISLLGTVGGRSVNIITSIGNDTLTYDMVGNNPRLYASLGLGNDSFAFNTVDPDNPNLSYLYIDFGLGTDVFTNMFMGPFTFRAYLRNLP